MKNRQGFTIIEAILTIAIGGLILSMVFIAIPYLSRNQRDGNRKDDISLFLSKISNYQANNRKALPSMPSDTGYFWFGNGTGVSAGSTTWFTFYNNFLGGKFEDPQGTPYNLSITTCNAATGTSCNGTTYVAAQGGETATISNFYSKPFPNNYIMLVVINGKCRGDGVIASHGGRNIAVLYNLENGGTFCSSN